MSSSVYVVHCIDTEGPLHEPIEATFERLKHIFNLELPATRANLELLRIRALDLGGIEKDVQDVVSSHMLRYNDTWDKIDVMLDDCMTANFRNSTPDSAGNGWIYNWFCMDHVDYDVNPRRRDIGYHNIFDHYRRKLAETASGMDAIHFHHHPHAFLKHAHICATHWWASSNSLYQTLARRIIDRKWFPAANRPGFQVNRPDSHWFLEQFIPFDYSSLATAEMDNSSHKDFSNGRSGDWRRAPRNWQPYHPDHDDYQRSGNCRRWITRCLNIGSRAYNLSPKDVRQAFEEAQEGRPTILSFANHDFRDIRVDVNEARRMIASTASEFPNVQYFYCEAISALRAALQLPAQTPCCMDMTLHADGDTHVLTIRTQTPTFGPQPYLAIKTVTQDYFHDNFDFQVPHHEWTYTFDNETFPIRAVEKIGVATNNAYGVTTVSILDTETGTVSKHILNATQDNE